MGWQCWWHLDGGSRVVMTVLVLVGMHICSSSSSSRSSLPFFVSSLVAPSPLPMLSNAMGC